MKASYRLSCLMAIPLICFIQFDALLAAEPMTLEEETAARIAADEAEALVRSATDAALLSTINENEATFNSATVALVAADGNEATARAEEDRRLRRRMNRLNNAEAAQREAGDAALQGALNTAIAEATSVATALQAKDMALMDADAAINTRIETEVQRGTDAIANLQTKDMALMDADAAEAAARAAEDAAINNIIDAQVTAVTNAIANLQAKDSALMDADAAEAGTRAVEDGNLQSADAALQAALTAAALEATTAAAALEAKDMSLMAADTTLEGADAALQSALNSAVSDLQSAIGDEATARQAADDTLGALLGDIVELPEGTSNGQLLEWNQGVETGEWVVRPAPSVSPTQAQENRQPFIAVNYICALFGVFPSRSGVEPYIGEIILFGGNFAPRSWAFCDGQLLPISQNTALFSLYGTMYGGDGRTTFALPDMRGRVVLGPRNGPGLSSYRIGDKGGVETEPGHTHTHN